MISTQEIDHIFTILSREIINPVTELEYNNHYTLLVAIILSAQATDKQVNKTTPALFAVVSTPEAMLDLGEEKLIKYISSIGLYKAKAKNVIGMSEKLLNEYKGQIPDTIEELVKLPGVGLKTANVYLNCAHGKPTIGVDTHVLRVSNRLGLVSTTSADTACKLLPKVIPEKWHKIVHHLMILHGRYTCTARNPKCEICSIKKLCRYYESMSPKEAKN